MKRRKSFGQWMPEMRLSAPMHWQYEMRSLASAAAVMRPSEMRVAAPIAFTHRLRPCGGCRYASVSSGTNMHTAMMAITVAMAASTEVPSPPASSRAAQERHLRCER